MYPQSIYLKPKLCIFPLRLINVFIEMYTLRKCATTIFNCSHTILTWCDICEGRSYEEARLAHLYLTPFNGGEKAKNIFQPNVSFLPE